MRPGRQKNRKLGSIEGLYATEKAKESEAG
jgi:hypothetical protein